LCHLLDCDAKGLANDAGLLGKVFENFVVMELLKQISWSDLRRQLYHFLTESGQEVDIVLVAGGKSVKSEWGTEALLRIQLSATMLRSSVPMTGGMPITVRLGLVNLTRVAIFAGVCHPKKRGMIFS
jgi:hypothetical protein